MPQKLTSILSIAGSDPCGCAGIQADIRAGVACGLHVMTAITAITAQNSYGVSYLWAVDHNMLSRQLEAIIEDVTPDAIKIGMIGSIQNGEIISSFIKSFDHEIPIVIDPVMSASSGGDLSSVASKDQMIKFYQEILFPQATVVTPNLTEADLFLNYNNKEEKLSNHEKASLLLRILNCNSLILKGGHSESEIITDLLADRFDNAITILESSHPKLDCKNLHGSGCCYSSILASYLALGFPLHDAFIKTSKKISDIIAWSCDYSLGNSSYGPLNLNNYRL